MSIMIPDTPFVIPMLVWAAWSKRIASPWPSFPACRAYGPTKAFVICLPQGAGGKVFPHDHHSRGAPEALYRLKELGEDEEDELPEIIHQATRSSMCRSLRFISLRSSAALLRAPPRLRYNRALDIGDHPQSFLSVFRGELC